MRWLYGLILATLLFVRFCEAPHEPKPDPGVKLRATPGSIVPPPKEDPCYSYRTDEDGEPICIAKTFVDLTTAESPPDGETMRWDGSTWVRADCEGCLVITGPTTSNYTFESGTSYLWITSACSLNFDRDETADDGGRIHVYRVECPR